MDAGRDQLLDWMGRRGLNQREAATYLGMDESIFTKIKNGIRTPGLLNAVKIERLTGIPIESWLSSELDELTEAGGGTSRKAR